MKTKLLRAFEFIKLWLWSKLNRLTLRRIDKADDLHKCWVLEKKESGYITQLSFGTSRLLVLLEGKERWEIT